MIILRISLIICELNIQEFFFKKPKTSSIEHSFSKAGWNLERPTSTGRLLLEILKAKQALHSP
jgi:hypothetical protein